MFKYIFLYENTRFRYEVYDNVDKKTKLDTIEKTSNMQITI
jgi:hypothetical protein